MRPILAILAFGVFSLMPVGAVTAAPDPLLESMLGQATQEAVTGSIDYVAQRTAIKATPNVLRARLTACGNCGERAELQRQLWIAERDAEFLNNAEAMFLEWRGIGPWEAGQLGVIMRPEHIRKQPQACIALYDRAFQCAIKVGDRSAGLSGQPCYSQYKLQRLCGEGRNKPFADYLAFLVERSRGAFLSEMQEEKRVYFNVPAGKRLPLSEHISADKPYNFFKTDSRRPGALWAASVMGMGSSGPFIKYGTADAFRPPWQGIVREDTVAVSKTARLIECDYLQEGTNLVASSLFWFGERPARADKAALARRMPNHPLLRIGDPIQQCPVDSAAADLLMPRVSAATLEQWYAGKLAVPVTAETLRAMPRTERSPDAIRRAEERNKRRRGQ